MSTVGLCVVVEAIGGYKAGFQSSHPIATWFPSANIMRNCADLLPVGPKIFYKNEKYFVDELGGRLYFEHPSCFWSEEAVGLFSKSAKDAHQMNVCKSRLIVIEFARCVWSFA